MSKLSERLKMDDLNKETMELRSYGVTGASTENGGDAERGNLDIPSQLDAGNDECEGIRGNQEEIHGEAMEDGGGSLQQDVVEDERQDGMANESKKEKRKGTCKCDGDLISLIISFCLMNVDQIMDVYNIYSFYKEGRMVFFRLCLVFTVLPALIIHMFVAQRFHPYWKALLYFPLAPFILLMKMISNHCNIIRDEKIGQWRNTWIIVKVVEGYLEAVPQLFIQMTALNFYNVADSFSYVKIAVSLLSSSLALLSHYTDETNLLLKIVSLLPVAAVLGWRAFVCTSLFSLPVLHHLSGFIPLVLSVLLAWVTERLSNKETLHRTFIKAVLLPPVDKTGIVASVVFCIGGLVFWLLTLSQPCSVLVFVLVTIIHFLGGLGWKVAEKYRGRCRQDESSCAMPSCICSCLTGSTSGQANIQQEH
ncbi:uncharacterized protein LOC122245630 [Penaeus japonicus]|uniref:uncharacterized protein LOC122245630 n=1 Tax=Penaeus japonicus TaxID=27405 RepID=UPI001C70D354|nr:uncharacterized protein LOC122245630 [Penaeus japonicus]